MPQIELSQDKFALVDADDYEYLSQWKWYFNSGYARRHEGNVMVYMHRIVMPSSQPITDHINGDTLDNRRKNLRPADYSQNQFNRAINKNNCSGVKGVRWDENAQRWVAALTANHKRIFIGRFDDLAAAARARAAAEKEYHANFVRA